MSATTTRQAALRPGSIAVPSLRPWKQTVTSAATAAPATAPVEASTPDGTSSATTVPIGGRIASIAWRDGPPRRAAEAGPEERVDDDVGAREPRAAHAVHDLDAERAARCRGSGGRRAGACGRRPPAGTRPPSRRPCRWRATTNPSPPLLPAPQTTAARPPPPSRMISSAAARPARSISTAPGMPTPSIAAGVDRAHLVGRVERRAGRSCVVHDGDGRRHPLRVRHREIDASGAHALGPGRRAAGEAHARASAGPRSRSRAR